MARPKKSRGKRLSEFKGEAEKHPIIFLRTMGATGIVFIFGGLGVIPYSFPAGAALVYFGFALLLLELLFDPWIIKNVSLLLNCFLFSIPLFFGTLFTLDVVAIYAPLEITSFAMRNHNHPAGTEVAGITWHKNLTALTVVLANPIADDYKDVDLTITPDKWVYRASFLRDYPGCSLTPISGNNIIFTTVTVAPTSSLTWERAYPNGPVTDMHDNAGNIYHPVASNDGYRLHCDRLLSRVTLQMIFALVSPDRKPTMVQWGAASGWMNDCGPNAGKGVLDCGFNERPNPSTVRVIGTYRRNLRVFDYSRTVGIQDAN